MKHLYFRCNGGDYFQGRACPSDGWSHPGIETALAAAETLHRGEELSIKALQELGVPQTILERIVLMEFGNAESKFDVLIPNLIGADGEQLLPLHKVDMRFK